MSQKPSHLEDFYNSYYDMLTNEQPTSRRLPMWVILIAVLVSLCSSIGINAQTNVPDLTKHAVLLKDTVINKVSVHLYVGAKGGRFIIVTSKAGKLYKKYIKG